MNKRPTPHLNRKRNNIVRRRVWLRNVDDLVTGLRRVADAAGRCAEAFTNRTTVTTDNL